ncbi:MOSC domain-containing protein [Marinomonas flavescens]|uniref:MOSC domain-containing protein n=1 Tax=Marinomonas flavescens TaxID=2529379 RepID=UPI00105675A6|nr:MOSC N-terminal beta barrel domain-containing protein [Marinomonas flavescens]
MSYSVCDISIYPIKSIKGISLPSSPVNLDGLWGDRRYMITKPNGDFITGREYPTLTLLVASLLREERWQLTHPAASSPLTLNPETFSKDYQNVVIWENPVAAQYCSKEADQWLSEILNEDVKLVYFGHQSDRVTSRRPDKPVAFADGYPFLLTTRASLDELNQHCPEHIQMVQFRSNIVVEGSLPFEEDTWKRIKIGDVIFENVKPCERCIFTTVNPDTAERSKKGEPMKTLGKFRLIKKEGVLFGINLIAENSGTIQQGDRVEVLEYQDAPALEDRRIKPNES